MGEREDEFLKLGFRILAVSPDRPEKLKESVAKNKVNYTLLSDSDVVAARAFGLGWRMDEKMRILYKGWGLDIEADSGRKHHVLPVPAAFIVDKKASSDSRTSMRITACAWTPTS
ncbi:MAG: redoxin domain-containing protein [Deltaproteobacteria bacterium]|nr:redoxin domain-containing protein [Deltaproteobacteria bacterium]